MFVQVLKERFTNTFWRMIIGTCNTVNSVPTAAPLRGTSVPRTDVPMRAILTMSILAITALTATTHADFKESLVHAFERLRAELTEPESKPSEAHLINIQFEVELRPVKDHVKDAVAFQVIPLSSPDTLTPSPCGNSPGIYIAEIQKTFCNLETFKAEVYKNEENKKFFKWVFVFNSGANGPFLLVVPVLQITSEKCELDVTARHNCATQVEVQVGDFYPFHREKVLDVPTKKSLRINENNFEWLNDLLTYNVSQCSTKMDTDKSRGSAPCYVTQPFLITQYDPKPWKHLVATLSGSSKNLDESIS